MEIKKRSVGSVLVLDVVGKMTLGEGDELLRETMKEIAQSAPRRVVLNLRDVPYIDSAGLMEVARCHLTITRAGGKFWIAEPSKRIEDLLSITKLLSVFRFVSIDGIEHLDYDGGLTVECPVCLPISEFGVNPSDSKCVCPICGTQIHIDLWASPELERVEHCEHLVMPSYENEHLTYQAGRADKVSINGRLDLFVAELVEKLWRAMPQPRVALFSATYQNCSEAGLRRVLSLCRETADGGQAVFLVQGAPGTIHQSLDDHGLIFTDAYQAWSQLRSTRAGVPGIPTRLRRS